jgi:regulator of protease activity HflC (stomatin/prohibitin superfamily)
MIATAIAVLVVLVLLLAVIGRAVKIIKEYQRIVVFRLGRAIGAKGPGLTIINPVIDRINYVDLREQYFEIPHQTAITKDNAPISIDFIMFYQVIDPVQSVVAVQDFKGAALNVAATTLRSVVGDMSLDDVLSRREDMNALLRVRLDEVTERWGVKVSNVEVREINPPPGVQEAMTRQMSAERTRRAVVTESEGQKQARSPWQRDRSRQRCSLPRGRSRPPFWPPRQTARRQSSVHRVWQMRSRPCLAQPVARTPT